MSADRATYLLTLTYYGVPKEATVGDGKTVDVVGVGQVAFKAKVNGIQVEGTLTDVSLIPNLATNLFSVAKAAKRGLFTTFSDRECRVTKSGRAILLGKKVEDDLYVLDLSVIKPQTKTVALTASNAQDLHEIMGHPSSDRLNKLLQRDSVKMPRECEPCAEA